MKNFFPYLGWLLLGAALVLYFVKGCNTPPNNGDNTKDSIVYWKNKFGDVVASLRKTENDFGTEKQTWLDSIAKLYGSNVKYIKEVIWYKTHGHDTIYNDSPPIVETIHDTINPNCPPEVLSLSKLFQNDYYKANVHISTDGHGSFAEIETYDTLTALWRTVKTGSIFNRKTYLELDLSNKNPYNKITGIHSYRQPQYPSKKFGIGLTAGYGYGFNVSSSKPFPFVGIGITYSLIRF